MNELNDEIKLTINLMQGDIDDGAHGELQSHLYSLLEMKREEIQKRLGEPSNRPLTAEELKAGGWWCADVSKDCASAFKSKGLSVFYPAGWGSTGSWNGCAVDDEGDVARGFLILKAKNKSTASVMSSIGVKNDL